MIRANPLLVAGSETELARVTTWGEAALALEAHDIRTTGTTLAAVVGAYEGPYAFHLPGLGILRAALASKRGAA